MARNIPDQTLLRKLRRFFLRRKGVELAYLFGSVAKGRKAMPNDIDIAVRLRRLPADPMKRLAQRVRLATQLKKVTGRTVDLALLNTASPVLYQQVFKYGILLTESRRGLHRQTVIRKLSEYFDLQPLYNFYLQRLDRRLGVH